MRRTTVIVALLVAAGAGAHWPAPDEIVAEVRETPGVVDVTRDATVPRLLLVRVGPAWYALAAERRLTLADDWRSHWRQAVPNGLVGVVDAVTARPAVNYDGRGRPRLAPPVPPPGTAATPP
jgi:hypothetical protein